MSDSDCDRPRQGGAPEAVRAASRRRPGSAPARRAPPPILPHPPAHARVTTANAHAADSVAVHPQPPPQRSDSVRTTPMPLLQSPAPSLAQEPFRREPPTAHSRLSDRCGGSRTSTRQRCRTSAAKSAAATLSAASSPKQATIRELCRRLNAAEQSLYEAQRDALSVQEEARKLRAQLALLRQQPPRVLPPKPLPQWEWKAANREEWLPFGEADCRLLEDAMPAGDLSTTDLSFNQVKQVVYQYDFQSMQQLNTQTMEVRQLRRICPAYTGQPTKLARHGLTIAQPEAMATPGNFASKTFAASLRSPTRGRVERAERRRAAGLPTVSVAPASSAPAGASTTSIWTSAMQEDAVKKLCDWLLQAAMPTWAIDRPEFAAFTRVLCPGFEPPSSEKVKGVKPVQAFTEIFREFKRREGDKTVISNTFDALVDVCDPVVLQLQLRKWLDARLANTGGGEGGVKYGDGIADAKPPEEVRHVPFYAKRFKPPVSVEQTIANLATWHTPQGRIWDDVAIETFQGNCKMMMERHSAQQSPEIVLPLYLYSVSLYAPFLWVVWLSPQRSPPLGRWVNITHHQLEAAHKVWADPFKHFEAQTDAVLQEQLRQIHKERTGLDEQELAGFNARSKFEADEALRAKLMAYEEDMAGGPGRSHIKLVKGWFARAQGLQVPDKVAHFESAYLEQQGYSVFQGPDFTLVRYENTKRGSEQLSPTHDTTAWLPAVELPGPKGKGGLQQLLGKKRQAKVGVRDVVEAAKSPTSPTSPKRPPWSFTRVLQNLPPTGLLDYIHSRRSEEYLRWGLPSWECCPAISRTARKLIERCYTVADQQKYDPALDKDFRNLLNLDKLLLADQLFRAHCGISYGNLCRQLSEIKCEPGIQATPQVISATLDMQWLMYEGQQYIVSFTGSRFAIVNCHTRESCELYRMKHALDDQPYWHLNYAMRMRQLGPAECSLTVTGTAAPGKYKAPAPPEGPPDTADDFQWQHPVDLVSEKNDDHRARWDPTGGELRTGVWQLIKPNQSVPILLQGAQYKWHLGTWLLAQLVVLIFYTDRAMVQLADIPEAKVGYSICPGPKGIKNYRGLANVQLPTAVYAQSKIVLWGQYSSSTTDRGVASAFAGSDSSCAIFTLLGRTCRCIAQWSRFAREKEWLYPPGVTFRVVSALTEEQQQILGKSNLQMFSMEEVDEFECLEDYVRKAVPFVAGGEDGAAHVMQLFRIIQNVSQRKPAEALEIALDPNGGVLYSKPGHYVVSRLPQLGAPATLFDKALHDAALVGRADAVGLLLDPSPQPPLGTIAQVNSRNDHGHTALHLAAIGAHHAVVKQLLLARANAKMLGFGFAAVEYAAMRRDHDTVRMLRPLTPGCHIPAQLPDFQPKVDILRDLEAVKKECDRAGLGWNDTRGKHVGARATVTLYDSSERDKSEVPVFWVKFGDGDADKMPFTTFKQQMRKSRGDLFAEETTQEQSSEEVATRAQGARRVEQNEREDFQLFVLRTTLEVAKAPSIYKYILDNGVASLVNDSLQQLVHHLPVSATQFMRDYFQDKLRTAPLTTGEYRVECHQGGFTVYLSHAHAQLQPQLRKNVAMQMTTPLVGVSGFSAFTIRAPPKDTDDGTLELFSASSCDVRYMFPIQKRLAHVFLALLGRRASAFTSGTSRDSVHDIVYHVPKIEMRDPRRGSGPETSALGRLADDREIVINGAVIDEVAAQSRGRGVVDTVYNEGCPGDPAGPAGRVIYGPGEFRISGKEIKYLESTTRIATTALLPPRLFTELAQMTSDPLRSWFFSLCRAVPLMEIEKRYRWAELRDMYERRYRIEVPEVVDREDARRKVVGQAAGDVTAHLDKLGKLDFELEQHRLWRDNSETHLDYLSRQDAMIEIAGSVVAWREEVLAAPRDYAFDTVEQVRNVMRLSLAELCCNACVSMQGYCFTHGVRGASNQLVERTPEPIVFLSAAGIDFNTPATTMREAPKYFHRPQAELGPEVPSYEGWKGWKRGAQDRLLDRVKDTYRIIFDSCQHHGVRNPSMLPMGLGVLLLNVDESDRDDVKEIYFRAQFELLSERDYGFEAYYINPAQHGRKAMEVLEKGIGSGEGGRYNDPQRGRFLRCSIIFHSRDVKFLAVELARNYMAPALLNPCDCSGLFLGLAGNYWETGRATYYVGEEDIGATSTLALSHTGISGSLLHQGAILHEGSRTVSRPARPQREEEKRREEERKAAQAAAAGEKEAADEEADGEGDGDGHDDGAESSDDGAD
eukprot:TRINITY_DN32400_c0_g1_i1.p1 TRINITY_DN32400_c0_g1~~TRINITY_DN32400_c0_g1_i1.p1  ORF type:complete len:2236 (+),score=768.33 TRINITY_DN32400_c0_g1_i1:52-6759(+)